MLTNLTANDCQRYNFLYKTKESKDLEKETLACGKLVIGEKTKKFQKEQKFTLELESLAQKIKKLIISYLGNSVSYLFKLGKFFLQKFKLLSFSGIKNKIVLIEFVYQQVVNQVVTNEKKGNSCKESRKSKRSSKYNSARRNSIVNQ